MTTYTPLNAILDRSYFPANLRKESNDDDILSYGLDAYRLLNLPLEYQRKIEVKEIINHNVELPSDIHDINLVTYLNSDSCVNNDSNNLMPIAHNENYNIFYKIWQDSQFYNERFLPMRNIGNSASISCTTCNNSLLNKCSETFSITPAKSLMTSIKDGFVCLDYDAEIKDENGNFLIINTPEIKRYLGLYAQMQLWLERAAGKEEQAFSMYKELTRMTELAMRKARGIQIMKNIDIQTINKISGTETYNQKLVRLPDLFYKKYATNG